MMQTPQTRKIVDAASHGVMVGLACLASYWLARRILAETHLVSKDDDQLGGMWSVVGTLFVYHETYAKSLNAACLRVAATSISFILCLAYLLIFPFSALGMAALICIGDVAVVLAGQPAARILTGITTTVIMVVAALSPHHAWKQPILRLIDTVVGATVGIAAVRVSCFLKGGGSQSEERDKLGVQKGLETWKSRHGV